MEENPVVSVVIPTYKRPKKLNRALESVINQTYQNLEIIVVNDDPDTNIDNIIDLKDDRIVTINHDKNKGAPAARNNGIRKSKGDFIAFLDDDDEWLPSKLDNQIDKLRGLKSDYKVIYSGYKKISKRKTRRKTPNKEGDIFLNLLKQNFIPLPTALIRKNVFNKIGLFDEKLKSGQDWDLWLRISKKYKFSYVSDVSTVIYLSHSDRISINPERKIKGWKRILDKYKTDYEEHPSLLSNKYKTKGVQLASIGADRKFCSHLFKKSLTAFGSLVDTFLISVFSLEIILLFTL